LSNEKREVRIALIIRRYTKSCLIYFILLYFTVEQFSQSDETRCSSAASSSEYCPSVEVTLHTWTLIWPWPLNLT